ncbi:NADAR family protein [Massilia sp. BJB1822]|uniref:NADAR family protein n=1 Tax=Massilia sp. BJB1822 TaxID=2744470 RepID=UPI0015941462|nr:NADAR family protein [Massilia sp. BJB1822]NVD97557.1 NADAR family protein [Massilia sp. BJB1822]
MLDTQIVEDLKSRFNSGEKFKYVFFWGHQPGKNGVTASCFSQWYEAPFTVDGERYLTAEHFMMAEKARLFDDQAIRTQVLNAATPGEAKALGRQVQGFDEAVWLAQRYAIVIRANEAKFAQNPDLGQFLQQTGKRILVEASPVDRIWGIGLTQDDEKASNPNKWRGLNLLGFALMQVRDQQNAA